MKIILALVVVLVVAGGAFFLSQDRIMAPVTTHTAITHEVSFMCADGSDFIAAFTDADTLRVIVKGEMVHEFPRLEGDGERYGDHDHDYTFAGEEAAVAVHGNSETTCTQPFDANNAPFNFGDAAEGAGNAQFNAAHAVADSIVGRWESTDDAKFTREFTRAAVIDSYENAVTATHLWNVTLGANATSIPYPVEESAVYLTLSGAAGEEALYFKVEALTPESLQLAPLGSGGMLHFRALP